ncbi:MAG: ATP-grasp domain-containing protein [Thermogutta sp.]
MEQPRYNILVTCGGKWVGQILQLRQAAAQIEALHGAKLFVADRNPITPAGQFADGSFPVPAIADPAYPQELLQICRNHRVGIIVPLIDIDVQRLSFHRELFAAEGVTLIGPPPEIAKLCFDKRCFSSWAAARGIPVPKMIDKADLEIAAYPLFAKPACGFGSIGARICHTLNDALRAAEQRSDLVFEEFLSGTEYSVDGYVNRAGACIVCVVRVREQVVGGEAYRSRTVQEPEVFSTARRTIDALAAVGHRGPINVQIIRGEKLAVIDVNPRLGSATVLSNQATGGRLYESLLREALGETVSGDPTDYRVGLRLWRFLGDVFFEDEHVLGVYPAVGRAAVTARMTQTVDSSPSQPAPPHFRNYVESGQKRTSGEKSKNDRH